ncbi:single-stranded DNA-binding protein [Paracoccus sp. TOH]|uniref:single-stranded DNA-binding protein n=1 Tax=Paracoccus sp. TOH TaxID=1263728 RepID=UPI0025B0B166|nr:single-stranded DNA-binding protein [Paracoccus sp. TOH]WJS87296.1 single-stranded DNA-binding protein [Paracoccus sp. TOH]
MLNINETRLMGRLADDPVFATAPNGREYMRVRVLTSKSYKDENGQWQERTTGHNVTTFDRYRIQHGRDRLRKGMPVYVEGENVESSKRDDQTGKVNYFRGVLVPIGGKLHFLDTGRAGDGGNGDEGADRASRQTQGGPQGGSSKGKSGGKSKNAAGNVPDGPPIDGKNPLDQHDYYDDEIPF